MEVFTQFCPCASLQACSDFCAVYSARVLLLTIHHRLCETVRALGAGVVVAFQANQLPNPLGELLLPGQPTYQVAAKHSLKPHFPTDHPASFHRVTQDAAVTVRLYDDKAGRRNQLLGEAVLPCKHIKARAGFRPMNLLQRSSMLQIWLPCGCRRVKGCVWHPQQQLIPRRSLASKDGLCPWRCATRRKGGAAALAAEPNDPRLAARLANAPPVLRPGLR